MPAVRVYGYSGKQNPICFLRNWNLESEPTVKTETETYDDLAKFLGRYVLAFQGLERNLDAIIELAFCFKFFGRMKNLTSLIRNRQKIEVVRSIVVEAIEKRGNGDQKMFLEERFRPAIKKLMAEGERRNRLLHATFIYELAEHGGDVLMGKAKPSPKGLKLYTEALSDEYQESVISEVADLCWEFGLVVTQLRQWSSLFEED